MTPPWHRSRLFRLGLIGWMLLLVAWLAFPGTDLRLDYSTGSTRYGMSMDSETVCLSYLDHSYPHNEGPAPRPGFAGGRYQKDPRLPVYHFAPAVYRFDEPGCGAIHAGMWFIVAIYTVVWTGGMVWWQRRKHRLMDTRAAA
jgi:hypothetical protein